MVGFGCGFFLKRDLPQEGQYLANLVTESLHFEHVHIFFFPQ